MRCLSIYLQISFASMYLVQCIYIDSTFLSTNLSHIGAQFNIWSFIHNMLFSKKGPYTNNRFIMFSFWPDSIDIWIRISLVVSMMGANYCDYFSHSHLYHLMLQLTANACLRVCVCMNVSHHGPMIEWISCVRGQFVLLCLPACCIQMFVSTRHDGGFDLVHYDLAVGW